MRIREKFNSFVRASPEPDTAYGLLCSDSRKWVKGVTDRLIASQYMENCNIHRPMHNLLLTKGCYENVPKKQFVSITKIAPVFLFMDWTFTVIWKQNVHYLAV